MSAAPAPRAVLFDKDGTFVDFDRTWGPALAEALAETAQGDAAGAAAAARALGFEPATATFRPDALFIAGSSVDYGPLWARALGREADPDFLRGIDATLRRAAGRRLVPLGDPAAEFATLKAMGFWLGIATNDAEANARAQTDALGLSPHLDFLAGYDSGHGRKPAPGMVTAFAASVGCAPGEVLFVGDSAVDMATARAAGAVAVGVLCGPAGREELASLADHLVADVSAAVALAGRLRAGASPAASASVLART